MKKVIITIMAIITVMTLVGCKSEPDLTTMVGDKGEHYSIDIETVNGEDRVALNMDGYEGLMEAYENGLVSIEYVEEVLFNS